jgi:hypothetical protein
MTQHINKPMLAVCVPTYGRADRLKRVAENIHENTIVPHKIYFIVEPEDTESQEAVKALGEELVISKYPGCHTGAANTVVEQLEEAYFIMANDDFNFHKEWDTRAIAAMPDNIMVCGVNDMGNGMCNTIFVVKLRYIREMSGVIDFPNTYFCPAYKHNYADQEFYETAIMRGVYTICRESEVEHMHPGFGKGVKDQTYQRSDSTAPGDQQTYNSRRHMWQ